jgi:hypothetical protein
MVSLVVLVGLLAAPAYADETLCIPLGELTLDPPDGIEQKRASVEFPHAIHFGYACQDCHHTWTGEAEVKSCSTTECHDQLGTPKNPETGEKDPEMAIRYYKKAYHQLCIGCHKEIKKKNEELELSGEVLEAALPAAGPTGCVNCHPKD